MGISDSTQTLTATQIQKRIMVVGGTGFLGFRVVAALIEAGAAVTVMIRPDQESKLQGLARYVQVVHADVWNKASLKGRGRGHETVVHLIGSAYTDPRRGLTYQQINLVAARNIISMAVNDGVPSMIYLSAVARPELAGEYLYTKREAEEYLSKSGIGWTIIRAPALYATNQRGIHLLATLSRTFPFGMLFGNFMPLLVDVAARGIAQIAMQPKLHHQRILYAPQLKRLARERRSRVQLAAPIIMGSDQDPEGLDEPPFGWLPRGY